MVVHIKTDRINVYAASRSGSSSLRKYFGLPTYSPNFYEEDWKIENWYRDTEKNIHNLIFIRHPYTRLKSAIALLDNFLGDQKNLSLTIRMGDKVLNVADRQVHLYDLCGPYLFRLMEMKLKGFRFEIARTEDIHDYIGLSAGPRQYVTEATLDGIDWASLPFPKKSIIQEYDTYLELLETVPQMTPELFKELTVKIT